MKHKKRERFLDFVVQDDFGFRFVLGLLGCRVEEWEGDTPHIRLSSLSTTCSRATPVTSSHQTVRNETASKPERFYFSLKAKHHFQLADLCCV